jgi:hypothetical protein
VWSSVINRPSAARSRLAMASLNAIAVRGGVALRIDRGADRHVDKLSLGLANQEPRETGATALTFAFALRDEEQCPHAIATATRFGLPLFAPHSRLDPAERRGVDLVPFVARPRQPQ